jgi:hypothetical protein
MKVLGVEETSPLYGVAKDIAGFLASAELISRQEFIDYGYEPEDIPEEVQEAYKMGYKVYKGTVHTDGESTEVFLCDNPITCKNDEIEIISEGF